MLNFDKDIIGTQDSELRNSFNDSRFEVFKNNLFNAIS